MPKVVATPPLRQSEPGVRRCGHGGGGWLARRRGVCHHTPCCPSQSRCEGLAHSHLCPPRRRGGDAASGHPPPRVSHPPRQREDSTGARSRGRPLLRSLLARSTPGRRPPAGCRHPLISGALSNASAHSLPRCVRAPRRAPCCQRATRGASPRSSTPPSHPTPSLFPPAPLCPSSPESTTAHRQHPHAASPPRSRARGGRGGYDGMEGQRWPTAAAAAEREPGCRPAARPPPRRSRVRELRRGRQCARSRAPSFPRLRAPSFPRSRSRAPARPILPCAPAPPPADRSCPARPTRQTGPLPLLAPCQSRRVPAQEHAVRSRPERGPCRSPPPASHFLLLSHTHGHGGRAACSEREGGDRLLSKGHHPAGCPGTVKWDAERSCHSSPRCRTHHRPSWGR